MVRCTRHRRRCGEVPSARRRSGASAAGCRTGRGVAAQSFRRREDRCAGRLDRRLSGGLRGTRAACGAASRFPAAVLSRGEHGGGVRASSFDAAHVRPRAARPGSQTPFPALPDRSGGASGLSRRGGRRRRRVMPNACWQRVRAPRCISIPPAATDSACDGSSRGAKRLSGS